MPCAVLIAAQSIDVTLHRRLRSIASTPRAAGNTSPRSTKRRPNCGSSGQCSEINCFLDPDKPGGLTRRTNKLALRVLMGFSEPG